MNSQIKIWDIPGGIHPPQNKTQSTQLALGDFVIPPQLIIPLNQHIGAPAKPLVKPGDKVLAGQLIAQADGVFSANVHASSSGIVTSIGDYAIPHASGLKAACVVIDTDGKHESIAYESCENYTELSPTELLKKIRAAGVAGLGGAGFPTDVKLSIKSTQTIDTLIINGAECEPYITADDLLMQHFAEDIILGTFLLSHILRNPTHLIIAVEDNKPKALLALQNALKNVVGEQGNKIELISIPTKYPSGGAKQLTQLLTGREIPHGHHSADVGAICVNVATVASAWRAVRFGEPLISRITTVVGEALSIQRNTKVLIGTPINFLLAQHGFDETKALRVVMGGSLMGFTLPDLNAPVIKTTNCILAASKKELPPPPPAQACIRCGLCSEVCPASLLPQQLFWYAQAEDTDRLQAHHLFDCIECGACSYVCPSKIPLVQYYRAAKGNIRQQVADKERADRSRQRFEFRQERFAKEEAAKELRRIARKKAADEAKQKLAAQKAAPQPTSEQHENLIIAAVTKAQSVQVVASDQRAKLERQVNAAKLALASAQAPLVARRHEPISQDRFEKQRAQIKQAELKLAEAEKKLAAFSAEENSSTPDLVAETIERAQAKLNQSPAEKLRANLEALQVRLRKAQEKADEAKAANSPSANALQKGVENIQQKIAQVSADIADAEQQLLQTAEIKEAEQEATERALAKAKEKLTTQAKLTDAEKREQEIQTLQNRLNKARERLAKAEVDGEVNLVVFKMAVDKLEEKLKSL